MKAGVRTLTSSRGEAAMSSKVSSTSLLSLGTFNAKGLSKTEKQEELGVDCFSYKVDILCIQET